MSSDYPKPQNFKIGHGAVFEGFQKVCPAPLQASASASFGVQGAREPLVTEVLVLTWTLRNLPF